jgi:hypothetical protein
MLGIQIEKHGGNLISFEKVELHTSDGANYLDVRGRQYFIMSFAELESVLIPLTDSFDLISSFFIWNDSGRSNSTGDAQTMQKYYLETISEISLNSTCVNT